jgi:hypothetical protein
VRLSSGARLLVLLPLLALGCAQAVQSQSFPALQERTEAVKRLAVAPFEVRGTLALAPREAGATPPSVAAILVARHLSEAIAARGTEVIPAEDVQRALGIEDPAAQRIPSSTLARLVFERFGADAVIVGAVHRYRDRRGEAMGAMEPAAVGFEVTLLNAPQGQKLWRATFDESQAPLSDNIFNAGRYPGGGSRWLTAEELARWGAEEVALALPTGR